MTPPWVETVSKEMMFPLAQASPEVVSENVDHGRNGLLDQHEVVQGDRLGRHLVVAAQRVEGVGDVLDVLRAELHSDVREPAGTGVAVAHDRGVGDDRAVTSGTVVDPDAVGVGTADVVAQFVGVHHQIPVLPRVVLHGVGEAPGEVRTQAVGVASAETRKPRDAAAEATATEEVGEVALDRPHVLVPVLTEGREFVAGAAGAPRVLLRPEPDVAEPQTHAEVPVVDVVRRGGQRRDVRGRGDPVPVEEAEQFLIGLDRESNPLAGFAGRRSGDAAARGVGNGGAGIDAGSSRLFQQVGSAEVLEQLGRNRREGVQSMDPDRSAVSSVGDAPGDAVGTDPSFDPGGTEAEERVTVGIAFDPAAEGEHRGHREVRVTTAGVGHEHPGVVGERIDRVEPQGDRAAEGEGEVADSHLAAELGGESGLVEQQRIDREVEARSPTPSPRWAGGGWESRRPASVAAVVGLRPAGFEDAGHRMNERRR